MRRRNIRSRSDSPERLQPLYPELPKACLNSSRPRQTEEAQTAAATACGNTGFTNAGQQGLEASASRFPPEAGKWNRIGYRMSARIMQNWQGWPLNSHQGVVNLIGATGTKRD